MSRIPRILPLAGLAVVGVLAINFAAGADTIPKLFSGAKAWAEGSQDAGAKGADGKTDTQAAAAKLSTAVCAPTAAELAKEAGLSPSELRMLQNLGERRGQLDAQEQGFDVQLQLMTAAGEKLDAKFKAMEQLKGDIKLLLGQADEQQQQEVARLVAVFSAMKPKDAAAQMRVLDDSVRLPIAAKMKERTLAAILAQMPPLEAKQITEQLAKRYTGNAAILAGRQALAPEPAVTPAGPDPKATASAAPPLAGAPTAAAPAPVKTAANTPRKTPAKAVKKAPAKQAAAATPKTTPVASADPKPVTPAAPAPVKAGG